MNESRDKMLFFFAVFFELIFGVFSLKTGVFLF